MDVEVVLLGDGAADRPDDLGDVGPFDLPLDLVDDDEPLVAVDLDGERRAPFGPERGVAPLDGPLDVLRVDVAAADDDQVLEAAGDEQLAVVDEAEVAGAEERALAGVGQGRVERSLRWSRADSSSPGRRSGPRPRSRRPGRARNGGRVSGSTMATTCPAGIRAEPTSERGTPARRRGPGRSGSRSRGAVASETTTGRASAGPPETSRVASARP